MNEELLKILKDPSKVVSSPSKLVNLYGIIAQLEEKDIVDVEITRPNDNYLKGTISITYDMSGKQV